VSDDLVTRLEGVMAAAEPALTDAELETLAEARHEIDAQPSDWFEMLEATADQFEAEYDDLEAILAGDIGFHCYFVADGDNVCRGATTAVFQALSERMEELHIDDETVKYNQGAVSPTAVADEVLSQLEAHTGLGLGEWTREMIREQVESRVRKNMDSDDGGERA